MSLPRLIAATLLLQAAVAAHAADLQPRAGQYTLATQMVMPHLDEMRRVVVEARRCVADGDVAALFPVLDQHALRGCRLDYPRHGADGDDYVLVCASARVASGTARLEAVGDDRLVGRLEVKMGGKNMTFSQRSEARRDGPCAAASR